ncbi:hypothetical protein CQW23_27664 [Capsicum baccatum]|uniref:Ubiquitin-like protease family profile domain-containing protein n=1 Tax=Capsicum baccatum TaxID=33114 RepID=A0A2G2VED5_CAPBA|nr:hypothetical protein CQW23_27664 [Capsicum baccatum]
MLEEVEKVVGKVKSVENDMKNSPELMGYEDDSYKNWGMSSSVNLPPSFETSKFGEPDGQKDSVKHLGRHYKQPRKIERKKKENAPIIMPGPKQSLRDLKVQFNHETWNQRAKDPAQSTGRINGKSSNKVDVTATAEEHNMTVDNPSIDSKDEEKVEPPLVDEVYIPINCGDEFHWVLAVFILKERRIRVYDSMSRRRLFGPSSEIQKLAKILPTYLDMSGFLDQKICTDWLTIEAYLDKMANPFDVQYVDGIVQQTIGSLDCGPFVAAYSEYLSDILQVPNNGLDVRLLHKRYPALLWKYGEAKAQKPYATNVKDPRQPKPNSIALDEE